MIHDLTIGHLDPAAIGEADAVIICVPTPVDTNHMPELSALHGACADVVAHAKAGQTIILTSTTYVGTTAELLAAPLTRAFIRAVVADHGGGVLGHR